MAQFINITDTELQQFPTWRAHNNRQVSRELAGIRGFAPAIHFHDTTYDTDTATTTTELMRPDDRILKVPIGEQIYFWGIEMYAGGYDTINVYYRQNSSSNWQIIKGTGYTGSVFISPSFATLSTSYNYYPNSNLINAIGTTGTTFYPNGISTITGVTTFDQYPYIAEFPILGYTQYYAYGTFTNKTVGDTDLYGDTGDPGRYNLYVQNHCRSFVFFREGEYLVELNEACGWAGSDTDGKNGTGYNYGNASSYSTFGKSYSNVSTQPGQGNRFYSHETIPTPPSGNGSTNYNSTTQQFYQKFNPINYNSNPGLYGTLKEQIKSNTTYSQNYRSCFTKKILIQSYAREYIDNNDIKKKKMIDCIDGSVNVCPSLITITPGTVINTSIINKPYQKVIGYGAVFEDNGSGNFITSNSPETTSPTTANQRFSNINQRWNGTAKTLINRRQITVEGLTIRGNSSVLPSKINFTVPSNSILDLRGSVFKNCTFENIIFDDKTDSICWTGCSFLDCKFKRCQLNMSSDSILFKQCEFIGRSEGTDTLNISGNSNCFMGCIFKNNFRTFFMSTDDAPCTDNLWFKCYFTDSFFHSGGNEQFISSNNTSKLLNAVPTGQPLLLKQKNREFSRNIFAFNRIYGAGLFTIGNKNSFSRANVYTMNDTFCPTLILTDINSTKNTSTAELSGGNYYDVHYLNSYRKFKMILGENTHHMRLLYNQISEPQLFGNTGGLMGTTNWDISMFENLPIFSIVSKYENPSNGYSDCKHTSRATGNKIIGNKIQNWQGIFANTPTSPCSIYLNFHNILHCSKCGADYYNSNVMEKNSNGILDWLDITDFDGDTISDGKFINIAYRNQLVNPEAQSARGKVSGYATNSDPCFGIGDSPTSIGTFTPLWFPNGVCKETIPYFNCNSIYIGSGTTYPNPYTNVFGTHGKQGNNFYRRISVPTYTNSATPITLVTNGSNPTIFTGDLFNRLDLK